MKTTLPGQVQIIVDMKNRFDERNYIFVLEVSLEALLVVKGSMVHVVVQ